MKHPAVTWFGLLALHLFTAHALAASPEAGQSPTITPGDPRLKSVHFEPYEARYTSRSSVTGKFTLLARLVDDGAAISLVDMIPMKDNVIVAQRRIHARTQAVEFSAGPLFSWGAEYAVRQLSGPRLDQTRIPIGGGEPIHLSATLSGRGVVSDMFAPTLAALWPLTVGEKFRLPVATPLQGGTVEARWVEYHVLREAVLDTPAGLTCECMVLEKPAPGGGKTHIWVGAQPPFIFRRAFDIGGEREFVSDLLDFEITP